MAQSQTFKKFEDMVLKLLQNRMGHFVESVSIRSGYDHHDEESLYIEATLNEDAPIDLGKEFIFSQLELKEALQAEGENRFPYLSTKRLDGKHPTDITIKSEIGVITKRKSTHKAQAI